MGGLQPGHDEGGHGALPGCGLAGGGHVGGGSGAGLAAAGWPACAGGAAAQTIADIGQAVLALLVAHVLSRWAAMGLPQWLPYVGGSQPPRSVAGQGEGSKARALVADLQWASFGVSTAWALPAMAWLVWASGWATLAWTLLAMGLLTWRLGCIFRRRLGGITGDCLGATQQLTELVVYLVLAVRLASSMPSVGT